MSWDPLWEKIFSERSEWGRYPPEELVRFLARYYYSAVDRQAVRVLEIGCGPGGGPSWYIAREGFLFCGLDGSASAIERARKRFLQEGLEGEFVKGEFNALPWTDGAFDSVIDVASLQCNAEEETRAILKEVHRVLKPGGRHFSLTARNGCWGDGTGVRIDNTSFRDIREGPYTGMGVIRFATQESLMLLYGDFEELEFEYSIRSMHGGFRETSNWIVTCRK